MKKNICLVILGILLCICLPGCGNSAVDNPALNLEAVAVDGDAEIGDGTAATLTEAEDFAMDGSADDLNEDGSTGDAGTESTKDTGNEIGIATWDESATEAETESTAGQKGTSDTDLETTPKTIPETATEESNVDNKNSENIENDTEETEMESTTLTYIGHASVKIVAKDGTVIYIDPNYTPGDYSAEADYILVTHDHFDHQPCKDVKLKSDGRLITNKDSLHSGTYETYDFGNVKIEAVAAGGNMNHSIKNCVGYLVTVDGITIYHAGDTSMVKEMMLLTDRHIDYAMYPIDGVYNMNAADATEVAELVGAVNNIPIHENDVGSTKKSDNFTPSGRMVLAYGETIQITPCK